MRKLWAPWRAKYILAIHKKEKGCLFCRIDRQKKDKKNFIFLRSRYSFAVLNIYPYNNGHSMVIPKRHVNDLSLLRQEEKLDLMKLLESTKSLIDKSLKPEGYNIGMNLGKIAGAGFPDHIHIHIVPRWKGDNNFMSSVANVKVISQSLEALLEKLSQCAHAKK